MNGKKAKELRRGVKIAFQKKENEFPYCEYEKQQFRKIDIGKTNPVTEEHEPRYVDITTTITMINACMKKQYKRVKKIFLEQKRYGKVLNPV